MSEWYTAFGWAVCGAAGISSAEIESLIGRVAAIDIAEDSVLQWDMFR